MIAGERIAEMAFAPLEDVEKWLSRIGLETRLDEDRVLRIRNPHLEINTAIYDGVDPIGKVVCLGFALAGMYWPQVYPEVIKLVNKKWKEARKEKAQPAGAPVKKVTARIIKGRKKGQRKNRLKVIYQGPSFEEQFRGRGPQKELELCPV